ncbi:MAG: UDP-N-acetylglucosamine--N-acetylmuramyl-(pentapeptide) pyrophosphoryl-undecaprenol N-acetylglucosamine transferase [Verrucomicrobiota bacterium]|nr:UDP-N-acetylglucosamine--N-acetylmuramyl-(pentapeptide) pyrophosphoryl-undecaprenol N-acetylglucosamine transferase [Verrucomicrobiota bacterium]
MPTGSFIIACGGTGGHLSPGIALAERLITRGHRVRLIVSRKEVDSRLCRKYSHLEFVRTPGAPFSLNPVKFAKCVTAQTAALAFSLRLLRASRPDAVIAFGGFTAIGLAASASILGIPVILHEANRRPGKAIKLLSKLCSRLYLPPGIFLSGVHGTKLAHPGYPLRKEIRRMNRDSARQTLGIDTHGKLLVIMGGSQGASVFNEWVRSNIEFLGTAGINVFCVTGLGKGTEGVFEFPSLLGGTAKAWFIPFADKVAELFSAADLVISRAGAGAMAELIQCRTPSILVPYPHAADNHQEENARYLEQQGASIVVTQNGMDTLRHEVRDLIFNEWMLERMRDNMRQISRHDAAEWIARDLERIVLEHTTAETPISQTA